MSCFSLLSLYTGNSDLKPDTINMKTVTKSARRFTYFVPVMLLGFRVCRIGYVRAATRFYAHNTGNDNRIEQFVNRNSRLSS